jgi:hypothetical protein
VAGVAGTEPGGGVRVEGRCCSHARAGTLSALFDVFGRRLRPVFSLALCSLLMNGCAPRVVAAPVDPPRLRLVRIAADVDDDVTICWQATTSMRFTDPNLPDWLCVDSVGTLRSRALRLRAAN